MTLLVTEIYCLDGLDKTFIVFAADRRISRDNKYAGTYKKLLEIPFLNAAIGYYGLAEVSLGRGSPIPMKDWLSTFIRTNSNVTTLQAFATKLATALNTAVPDRQRNRYISGFHIAGYNSAKLPEFWFVRNVDDDRVTFLSEYEAREDFLARDALDLGYDGSNPRSVKSGTVRIYRNGDIRAHVLAWGKIDDAFGELLREREFRSLTTSTDYADWARFKMELIAYFYKKYCRISLIARPIDTIVLTKSNT